MFVLLKDHRPPFSSDHITLLRQRCAHREDRRAQDQQLLDLHIVHSMRDATNPKARLAQPRKGHPVDPKSAVVVHDDCRCVQVLVHRHRRMVYRVARAVTGCCDDAEDVAQEAFLRAYGAIRQYNGHHEFAGWLSVLTGSLAKMAQDIILLAQNEVGEVIESGGTDRGGSSAMPQKRNPIVSELVIAAARTNASLLSAIHNAMVQEHERATHGWQIEWLTLSQMIGLTSGALKNALFLTENIKVNEARMRENLNRSNYVVLAEGAVQALSEVIARTEAYDLVKQACSVAVAEERSLIAVVKEQFSQIAPQNKIDWEALAKPENYLGLTQVFIDRVLAQVRDRSEHSSRGAGGLRKPPEKGRGKLL